MPRLIAFGCSFTYGHGLPGSGNGTPSKQAWPQVAADLLQIECTNMGMIGIGNKHILHNLLNFNYTRDDIVVVMWSFFDRHAVIQDDHSITDLGPWMADIDPANRIVNLDVQNIAESYYLNPGIRTDLDDLFVNALYINYADSVLKKKQVNLIHTSLVYFDGTLHNITRDAWHRKIKKNIDIHYMEKSIKWNSIKPALVFTGRAGTLPDGHPNAKSHRIFGNTLAHYIREQQHV